MLTLFSLSRDARTEAIYLMSLMLIDDVVQKSTLVKMLAQRTLVDLSDTGDEKEWVKVVS